MVATADWIQALRDLGIPGLVGVVIGAALGYLARRQERKWQQEQARRARELVAAEKMDAALVETLRAIDYKVDDRYREAHKHWEEGWVRYSPRIRSDAVLERYEAVGSILMSYVMNTTEKRSQREYFPIRAVTNARATLGYFMRDENLPSRSFPSSAELIQLLDQGRRGPDDDPLAVLMDWLETHPEPAFHPPRRHLDSA